MINHTESSEEPATQGDLYEQPEPDKKLIFITQCKLNGLVRDLSPTKQQSELFASNLQKWNLLDEDACVTIFRKRSLDLQQNCTMENKLSLCVNIGRHFFFYVLGFGYKLGHVRLFTDVQH